MLYLFLLIHRQFSYSYTYRPIQHIKINKQIFNGIKEIKESARVKIPPNVHQ